MPCEELAWENENRGKSNEENNKIRNDKDPSLRIVPLSKRIWERGEGRAAAILDEIGLLSLRHTWVVGQFEF